MISAPLIAHDPRWTDWSVAVLLGAGWRSALAVMLMCSGASISAAEEARFQITPFGSYLTGGEFETEAGAERDVDDTTGWGLMLSLEQTLGRYYELVYTELSADVEGAPSFDVDIQYLQIGGTVAWPEATRVIPYFALTVGAAHFSPQVNGLGDATRFAFSVGGGVRIPISQNIGVRAELRSYITALGNDADLFCESDQGVATCELMAKSDTLLQHSVQLGVIVGF